MPVRPGVCRGQAGRSPPRGNRIPGPFRSDFPSLRQSPGRTGTCNLSQAPGHVRGRRKGAPSGRRCRRQPRSSTAFTAADARNDCPSRDNITSNRPQAHRPPGKAISTTRSDAVTGDTRSDGQHVKIDFLASAWWHVKMTMEHSVEWQPDAYSPTHLELLMTAPNPAPSKQGPGCNHFGPGQRSRGPPGPTAGRY